MWAVNFLRQNPPDLNWRCWLTQVGLGNDHKMLVVIVVLLHVPDCVLLTDADFDSPLQLASIAAQQFVPDEGSVSMIESMGFTHRQAAAALKATVRTHATRLGSRL